MTVRYFGVGDILHADMGGGRCARHMSMATDTGYENFWQVVAPPDAAKLWPAPVPVADHPERVGTWVRQAHWRCSCHNFGVGVLHAHHERNCVECGTDRPSVESRP